MFTAEEVRQIVFQVANPGRLEWTNTVLREHGISAESPTPRWAEEAKQRILGLLASAGEALTLEGIMAVLDLRRVTCLRLLGSLESEDRIVVGGFYAEELYELASPVREATR